MSMLSLYEYPTMKQKILGWVVKTRFKIDDNFLIEIPIILWICFIVLLFV